MLMTMLRSHWKLLLGLLGWILLTLSILMRPTPKVVTQTVEKRVEIQAATQIKEKLNTVTVTRWLPSGEVVKEERLQKDTDRVDWKQEKSQEISKIQTSIRPDHLVGLSVRIDSKSLETHKLKSYDFTYGHRVIGNLWITSTISTNRELGVGLRYDF